MSSLSLCRKVGERILIGDDIAVEVTQIRSRRNANPRVVLKVTAPPSVRVDREEVREQRLKTPAEQEIDEAERAEVARYFGKEIER